jgi:hypothetical protein
VALPMESDRQGRAPGGPYFFFFLVAFFLATASPPSDGLIKFLPLLGMLVRWPISVKAKIPYLGVRAGFAPKM